MRGELEAAQALGQVRAYHAHVEHAGLAAGTRPADAERSRQGGEKFADLVANCRGPKANKKAVKQASPPSVWAVGFRQP